MSQSSCRCEAHPQTAEAVTAWFAQAIPCTPFRSYITWRHPCNLSAGMAASRPPAASQRGQGTCSWYIPPRSPGTVTVNPPVTTTALDSTRTKSRGFNRARARERERGRAAVSIERERERERKSRGFNRDDRPYFTQLRMWHTRCLRVDEQLLLNHPLLVLRAGRRVDGKK
jgi:hypothetical protein